MSFHQFPAFPGSGWVDEIGEGKGKGFNINIPLPPGSGTGAYDATFDRVVLPALRAYQPELIIVPSGFDAGAHDPLGRQMMTSEGYRSLAKKMRRFSDVRGGLFSDEGMSDCNGRPYGARGAPSLAGRSREV